MHFSFAAFAAGFLTFSPLAAAAPFNRGLISGHAADSYNISKPLPFPNISLKQSLGHPHPIPEPPCRKGDSEVPCENIYYPGQQSTCFSQFIAKPPSCPGLHEHRELIPVDEEGRFARHSKMCVWGDCRIAKPDDPVPAKTCFSQINTKPPSCSHPHEFRKLVPVDEEGRYDRGSEMCIWGDCHLNIEGSPPIYGEEKGDLDHPPNAILGNEKHLKDFDISDLLGINKRDVDRMPALNTFGNDKYLKDSNVDIILPDKRDALRTPSLHLDPFGSFGNDNKHADPAALPPAIKPRRPGFGPRAATYEGSEADAPADTMLTARSRIVPFHNSPDYIEPAPVVGAEENTPA